MLIHMLERMQKFNKCLTIWRKHMFNESATVSFIEQPCLMKPSGMFADCFGVGLQRINNFLKGNPLVFCHKKKNLNSVVIRNPLKVSFHLFGCLDFLHTPIVLHTNILKFVGM